MWRQMGYVGMWGQMGQRGRVKKGTGGRGAGEGEGRAAAQLWSQPRVESQHDACKHGSPKGLQGVQSMRNMRHLGCRCARCSQPYCARLTVGEQAWRRASPPHGEVQPAHAAGEALRVNGAWECETGMRVHGQGSVDHT